jgi:hypothetical protein
MRTNGFTIVDRTEIIERDAEESQRIAEIFGLEFDAENRRYYCPEEKYKKRK